MNLLFESFFSVDAFVKDGLHLPKVTSNVSRIPALLAVLTDEDLVNVRDGGSAADGSQGKVFLFGIKNLGSCHETLLRHRVDGMSRG